MELVLPQVLPSVLTPTRTPLSTQALSPVANGVLSQQAVVNDVVQQAVPGLTSQQIVTPSLAVANAGGTGSTDEGSQGVSGGGVLTPESANVLAAGFRRAGQSLAANIPGAQEGVRTDRNVASSGNTEPLPIPEPEQPVAEAAVGSLVPEGATSVRRSPVLDEQTFQFDATPLQQDVGSRRFGQGANAPVHPTLGYRRDHNGLDIGAPFNTPIAAPADGVVSFVGNYGGGGTAVIVDHGDGFQSKYMHLQPDNLPAVGQQLFAGDSVALVGSTGLSTGPHLHFELWQDGAAIDPLPFWVNSLPPERQVAYQDYQTVTSYQRVLADAGFYDGEIDGDFGPVSQQGLRSFVDEVTSQDILGIN